MLRAILLRWPDITLDELWRGIDLTASRRGGPTHHPALAKALALFCSELLDLHHRVVGHHGFVTDVHPIQGHPEVAAQCESHIDPDAGRAHLDIFSGVPAETKYLGEIRLVAGDRPSQRMEATRNLRNGAWLKVLHGPRLDRLFALVRASIAYLSNFSTPMREI